MRTPPRKGLVAIDILYLVDRLEALLVKGWRFPGTAKTFIDEDEFLDIVDQMRIAIPEEIKQAKKIVQERDRIVAQAQEEAQRINTMAKEDHARLVNEHTVTKAAENRASEIESQAQSAAVQIRQGADLYAVQTLQDLQAKLDLLAQQVAGLQTQVYNGLNVLVSQNNAPGNTPNEDDAP